MTESRQIGEGGMMILSPVDLPQGARILVNFMIPGAGPLILQSQVLYRIQQEVGFRYGLRFLNVRFEQRRWIRNYVALKTESEAKSDSKLGKILSRTNSKNKANFAA